MTGFTGSGQAATGRAGIKAGLRILPLLGLAYLLAFMDRINVSFAATQMNSDLGFSATVYGLGAGMFFLAYSLFEIPSNLLLLRFGARRWIARIMVTWGFLSAAMMFVTTPGEFYALRFAIGAAEAGFFPGAVFYLSSWFPRAQRGRAISLFYLFGPLASVVVGLPSTMLLGLDGTAGLRGWQWLFLVEGLPAGALGAMIFFFLPDSPEKADWLTHQERASLLQDLEEDRLRMGGRESHNVFDVLRNPIVVLLAMMGFLNVGTAMTFVLSAPMILTELTGRSTQQIGLLVTVGGFIGMATMALTGWFTDRRGERFPALLTGLAFKALGLLAIALAPVTNAVFAAYLLFVVGSWMFQTTQVAVWGDALRERQLALGGAAINTVAQLGAFLFPLAFGAARDATGTYSAGLLMLPALVGASILLSLILWRRVSGRVFEKSDYMG